MNVYLESLGCDKNLVDSEIMLGLMDKAGLTITNDPADADIAVINTCCFIGDAKEESIERIISIGEYKKNGRLKGIIATGCLAERYADEMKAELPEVDVVIGTTGYSKIVDAIKEITNGDTSANITPDKNILPGGEEARVVPAGEVSSYIKIAEGCDKRCTYCIIPYVRGNYRSLPMEVIVDEATKLAAQGTKELILVAQETTLYGTDIYGHKALPELLGKLSAINGIEWIRLLYCYPEEIDDSLIKAIKENPKVCHYLDMPIQHSEDRILKKMGRRTNKAELKSRIAKLRSEIPDIALRTTLMAGFPGETEEEYEAMYNFVNETEFDRLGVFAYSREEGTPAAEFPDQVPSEISNKRRDELMELASAISADKNEARVGKVYTVMVEGSVPDDNDNVYAFNDIIEANGEGKIVYAARTYMDAPSVDGLVFFVSDEEIMSGAFAKVKITAASEYDLYGELI